MSDLERTPYVNQFDKRIVQQVRSCPCQACNEKGKDERVTDDE